MSILIFVPPALAGLGAFSAWARRRLSRSAQRQRLELAERGKALLLRSDLGNDVRTVTEFHLRTAFSSKKLLIFSIAVIPGVAATVLLRPTFRQKLLREADCPDQAASKEFERIQHLANSIRMANHPALSLFALSEIALFIVPAVLLGSLISNEAVKAVDNDEVLRVVEMRRSRTGSLLGFLGLDGSSTAVPA